MRPCPSSISHSAALKRALSKQPSISYYTHIPRPPYALYSRAVRPLLRCPNGFVADLVKVQHLQPAHCICAVHVQVHDVQPIVQLKNACAHAEAMERQGMPLSRDFMYLLLQKSIEEKELDAARRAHSLMINSGCDHVSVLDDRLIQLFALCGSLLEANLVFCLVEIPSCHTWHAIVSAYAGLGCNKNALHIFGQMQCIGIKASKVTFLCILRVCAILAALTQTILTHGLIIGRKFESDVEVGNALLNTYAKCWSVLDARCVFEKAKHRDVISWNTMIGSYAFHEQYILALECFCEMQEAGVRPNKITYSCIFTVCGASEALQQGRLIHEKLLKSDIHLDVILKNTVIDMYARCGSLEDAYKVFNNFPDRDVVSWSAIIAGCADHGLDFLALEMFAKMEEAGMMPDRISYVNVLRACGMIGALRQAMLLHAEIVRRNFELDVVTGSTLVDMYARCACLDEALNVFNGLQGRNLVSWNAMIAGYVQHERPAFALRLFECMQRDCVQHDELTSLWILKACGILGASEQGHWIHEHAVRAGFESNTLIETSLIDMYIKLGELEGAQGVFNRSSNPSLRAWNAMIAGYTSHKQCFTAMALLEMMRQKSLNPDEVTLSCISKACASIQAVREGKLVHDQTIRSGVDVDIFIGNCLINMYIECGDLMAAQKVFENLPIKDVVSWNSMITGYARCGFDFPAIELFEQMQQENQSPDVVTCLCILKACSNVGAIQQGKLTHDCVIRIQVVEDMVVGSALVNMYAKNGWLHCAWKVLHDLPKRNVVLWGALISGYAHQGCVASCKQCLQEMQSEGLSPDDRIYCSILAACSHTGLVEEGRQHFKDMQEVHSLVPIMEHCSCMIDLLCRAGCLLEARQLLCTMPVSPHVSGWMSLFTACRIHGNKELARLCFDRAAHLDPDMAAGFVAMLNVFEDFQMWDDVHKVQTLLKFTGVKKKPGRAWLEVNNKVHEFVVLHNNDWQHENALLGKLESLKRQMMHLGYSPQIFATAAPDLDPLAQDLASYMKLRKRNTEE